MDSTITLLPSKFESLLFISSRAEASDRSIPIEFFLSLKIFLGSGISFVSSDIFFTGLSASHSESVSGSRSLLIKELFAPFSNSLLTRYGSKSLYLPIGA